MPFGRVPYCGAGVPAAVWLRTFTLEDAPDTQKRRERGGEERRHG